MWILIVSLFALGCFAALAGWVCNRRPRRPQRRTEEDGRGVPTGTAAPDAGCCGQHAVCERDSLLAAAASRVEYYDDEELDRYAGLPADRYTPRQEEDFREVFYTMREEDVAGWVRSLQLRGIALPDGIRDEVLLVVGERRNRQPKEG